MMHIGFLTPEYPHRKASKAAGIGTSIKNLAVALVKKEVDVSIYVYGQECDMVFHEDGMKFHLIRQRSYPIFGWFFYRRFLQNYLNNEIAAEKIDLIEAPDWTGITAFMKFRIPLVLRMNGSDTYFCHLEERPQKRKNFWFEKIAVKGADHLLSVSVFTAQKSAQLFKLKKEITVIPNSVDTEIFRPSTIDVIPGKILYFGSIIRKKGVLELAEIFNLVNKKNPEASLFIVGKDIVDYKTGKSTRALMEEILTGNALKKVRWLGFLEYNEIMEEVASAQVVSLPSFAEALPMTWLEAMAMEKALITSNIGWAKEIIVNGKTGFSEDPKQHESYAEKMLELLDNPSLAEEMGKAARNKILCHFSSNVIAEKNISFYKSII